jgi:hypothetical protein
MPGFLLTAGATVLCSHGGEAQPITPFPKVLVAGMPVVTIASQYVVAGCPFVPPGGNGPCVTAQWIVGATRVFAGGAPVLLQGGQSICAPTGTPLLPLVTQTKVAGT